MTKVGIVSLGCPRNLVDSEVMLGSLKDEGFEITDEVGGGVDIFIVNTCSFVESAREESVATIIEAAHLKKEGKIRYLIVAGCLPQLYKRELLKSLPEVDAIVGTSDFPKIADIAKKLTAASCPGQEKLPVPDRKRQYAISDGLEYLYSENSPRFTLTPRHYAYVKISEGCDNLCSYCIISRLRGLFRSRAMDSVVKEIRDISAPGSLREINLIGQDTTLFGKDLYGKSAFAPLLKKICALENSVKWLRILYTHPAHYTDEFISVVRDEPKICKYLDLPVQHISDIILKKMNRHTTRARILTLIENIRKSIPGIALRTSVIVGFPGETDKEFRELLDFLKDTRFERLGAFIYSDEQNAPSAKFKGKVPEAVKKERFDRVMALQQKISLKINQSFMGKTLDVLIDEKAEDGEGLFVGRTEYDAPEVDGSVHVKGRNIKVGEFCKVKITDTLEYDLVGEKA